MIESIKEMFLNTFQLLTPKQQKIWRYLQWYSSRFRQVFPAHQTIAKAVGCCRDTVIETVKKFVGLGWLGTMKRTFRSNLYFMNEELIDIDTEKSDTFKRQIQPNPTKNPTAVPTANPTQLYSNNEKSNERLYEPKNVDNVQYTKEKKEEIIAPEVKDLPIPHKDKVLFSRYSPKILHLAIEDWKTYSILYRVKSLPRFLMSRIKSYFDKFQQQQVEAGICFQRTI